MILRATYCLQSSRDISRYAGPRRRAVPFRLLHCNDKTQSCTFSNAVFGKQHPSPRPPRENDPLLRESLETAPRALRENDLFLRERFEGTSRGFEGASRVFRGLFEELRDFFPRTGLSISHPVKVLPLGGQAQHPVSRTQPPEPSPQYPPPRSRWSVNR